MVFRHQRIVNVRSTLSTLVLFTFLTGPVRSFTQETGFMSGTIMSALGARIPGASVSAKNGATGEIRIATVAQDGSYTLANLPSATYEITASEHAGEVDHNLLEDVETVEGFAHQ
jgi:hypothetical protein